MIARFKLWAFSAALAVLLHAAATAGFVLAVPPELEQDDDGAPAIEVGIELAAPRQEQSDLPPGPPADDAAASTASVARDTTPDQAEDRPRETPVESEEPDRVVTPETPPEEPKEVVETPAPETSQQADASTPSEAAAPPSVETPRAAETSTAPTPGTGASATRVRSDWQRQLIRQLDRNKRFPPGASRREAEIVVTFTIDRMGKLLDARIAKGSGDARLDAAALDMMRRADPLPAPPPVMADDGLTFTLPVNFTVPSRR